MVAMARKAWRQLTSMRTALLLLFLLAVAAVPGSLLPQRGVAIERVQQYLREHPDAGPWLDKFSFFDVYSSPWFSAVYLLLFTSLIGCVLPRIRQQAVALFRPPPVAPRNLDRLPAYVTAPTSRSLDDYAAVLRRSRFRVAVRDGSISAEKGYLRETGNLLFHCSLIVLLVGVALGSWYGWHGNRLVVEGPDGEFCNTLQQYDDYGLGPRVDAADLPPFCVRLDGFAAEYLDNGQPVDFSAEVAYTVDDSAPSQQKVAVNHPLRLPGANVYLLGHGYAPVLEYTDRFGRTQQTVAPFLPSDPQLTSAGAAIFPDANRDPATGERRYDQQLGFQGVYLPTVPPDPSVGGSLHPAERNPALMLVAYRGNLGVDNGIPHSVYALNTKQIDAGRLKKIGEPKLLRAGDVWKLDDGSSVKFVGTRQWATVSVRNDPGEAIVLAGAVLLLLGLLPSLSIRRRRIFIRVTDGNVHAGALARNDYPGLAEELNQLALERPGLHDSDRLVKEKVS
ncbi:MAG: cytochrome c biogenesis protein ResB [Longispora sp.]|nr:cytochrome c biogenesis protein ResB [Longispora sp. (in: high G+C Gram-positive bacteria)]